MRKKTLATFSSIFYAYQLFFPLGKTADKTADITKENVLQFIGGFVGSLVVLSTCLAIINCMRKVRVK